MPFTLAHAAAALPLRRALRGSAVFPLLVIGCFIPDLPYFLPEPLASINAHQPVAMALFGVPCGWLLFLLWHLLLREPAAALLPARYAALLVPASGRRNTMLWLHGTFSLLVGAWSHAAWDAFTHRCGLVVQAWPELARPLVQIDGHSLEAYFFLQHASTAAGLLCLMLYARSRSRQGASDPVAAATGARIGAIARLAPIAALALSTVLLVAWSFMRAGAARLTLYNVVCHAVSATFVVAMIYALGWHARARFAGIGLPRTASPDPPPRRDR
jgi:hypothetical protein